MQNPHLSTLNVRTLKKYLWCLAPNLCTVTVSCIQSNTLQLHGKISSELVLMKVRGWSAAAGFRVWAVIREWWCLIMCWRSHLHCEIHRLVESAIRHPAGEVTDWARWPPPRSPSYWRGCACACLCTCGPVCTRVCCMCCGDVCAHAALIRPLIPGCFKAAAMLEWNDTDTKPSLRRWGRVRVYVWGASPALLFHYWSCTPMRTVVAWIIVTGSDTWQIS